MTELSRLQRWFQAVITHPMGAAAGAASSDAASFLGAESGTLESLVTRSRSLSSLDRVQIYANAYHSRLIECLEAEFPAFRHAVGGEAFAGFALEFLQKHPPHSHTLSELGRPFPQFLEQTRPAARNGTVADSDWPAFLIELARLERLYAEIFDGPGSEGAPLLSADALQAIAPDDWGELAFQVCPSLQVIRLGFPAHEYISAVRRGDDPAIPPAAEGWLAVCREEYVVRRMALPQPAAVLLRSIREGRTLNAAVQEALDAAPVPDAGAASELLGHLPRWFEEWTARGWLRKAHMPAPVTPASDAAGAAPRPGAG